MLIQYDTSSKGQIGYNGNLDISHTIGNTYDHPYVFVVTGINAQSVTWNGTESLTHLRTYQPTWPPGTNNTALRLWGLANPTTGTHTMRIVTSDACPAIVVSYSTMDATQPVAYNEENSANNQVASWPPSVTTTNGQQWVVCFVSYPSGSSRKIAAGSGATLRSNQWGSILSHGLAVLDLNGEQSVGTHTVNLDVTNSSDNVASDFITTLTVAIEPYRTNVTPTPSAEAVTLAIGTPTITAIQNVSTSVSVQALRMEALSVIPPMIVEPSVIAGEFTILPIRGVRTISYGSKYEEQGDTYSEKYVRRT